MPDDHWEHFEHGADIGVRGIGATKSRAFVQAADAAGLARKVARTEPLVCVKG
ncbi:MAG: hypothetical protein AB1430_22500 [Pseudomonadota bacterium]